MCCGAFCTQSNPPGCTVACDLFKSPSVQLFVLLWKPFHVYVHSTPCVSSLLFIQFLRVAQSHQFLIAKEIDFFYFWYPDQLKLLWLEHVKINAVLKSQQFITFQGWAEVWLRHELVKLSKGCECHRICASVSSRTHIQRSHGIAEMKCLFQTLF